MQLCELDALALRDAIRSKKASATEVAQAHLDRISALDAKVGAFLHVAPERALADAKRVDAAIAAGEALGPLAGVPVAIKDNLCTQGLPTTAASQILKGFVPPYEGTATRRLAEAGTVTLGKVNMDEFGMGSSTENSSYQPTRNPWNLDCVPGGSSGGSAAAVASGMAPLALGSDTGGSIRQPASLCGLVGLKPTYGRVSRHGLIAYASSLDTVGPLTRTVRDNAAAYMAIAGPCDLDATSLREPVEDALAACDLGVQGLRVGVVSELMGEGLNPEVKAAIEAALKQLESLGATLQEVHLPHAPKALATYYVLATAEASSNLARYDGVRYGQRREGHDLVSMYRNTRALFGAEVKRRIMLGTYGLSAGYSDAYYKKALQVRHLIQADFLKAFESCDVLVAPTSPTTAFRLGEKTEDPVAMYLADVATIPINLAGIPALSLPCGFDAQGLPIGLQLIAKPLAEATLYRTAAAYEGATEHHRRRPAIA